MARFNVLAPTYTENGVKYGKGQVVDSIYNLPKMFPGLFTPVALGGDAGSISPSPVTPARPKKGRRSPVAGSGVSNYRVPSENAVAGPTGPSSGSVKDVTKSYPEARERGLRVKKLSDGKYNVLSASDATDTPLNVVGLTKTELRKFIKTVDVSAGEE